LRAVSKGVLNKIAGNSECGSMFVVSNLGVYIFLLGVDPTICQQCHKGMSWWPWEGIWRNLISFLSLGQESWECGFGDVVLS
jgi:hypothetical protein